MKRWIKRTLIGVFGASVLFGGFAAWAHRHHHSHGWHSMSEDDQARLKARVVDKLGARLDLDAAQKARLATVADKLADQRRAMLAGGDPRRDIQALVSGASFDREKAKAFIDVRTQAVASGSPELIAAFGDFYDSLKPEQQQKVREFLNRGSRWGHHDRRG